ncbi:MAG: Bacteriophage holin family [Massilia sp.]|nr:Bacteriophage holin family [Massilia sp.]
MNKLTLPDMTSYAGVLASLLASFTLGEWSVLAGIVTALVTCASNVAYMRRKDAREQRQAELAEREALARLEGMKPK